MDILMLGSYCAFSVLLFSVYIALTFFVHILVKMLQ